MESFLSSRVARILSSGRPRRSPQAVDLARPAVVQLELGQLQQESAEAPALALGLQADLLMAGREGRQLERAKVHLQRIGVVAHVAPPAVGVSSLS